MDETRGSSASTRRGEPAARPRHRDHVLPRGAHDRSSSSGGCAPSPGGSPVGAPARPLGSAPGPDAARRTGGGGGIPPRRARLRAIRFVPRPSFSDHDHQRGGSVMPRKRNGVSRREFIRDAALLSGSLAAVGLPGVARAQGTAAPPKLGAQLIGKLEGPELILDPAKWPTKFSEAPMLAELVKRGSCRRWSSGSPKEPLVIKPVHEIGGTGGPGGGASRAPATARTATASCPRTSSCSGNTPEPRSARASPRVAARRRREVGDPLPPEGSQVVGRKALHRRRLHVLVRGHLPEQGHRAGPASRTS